MNLQKLNQDTLFLINRYLNLNIAGQKVVAPYFINNVGLYFGKLMREAGVSEEQVMKVNSLWKEKAIPYGWYRGKATPEQLEESAILVLEQVGFSLNQATSQGTAELMKLFGIGIDCSGFVYNSLAYAFEKQGQLAEFNNSLAWAETTEQRVSRAGAFVFAGKASIPVEPSNLQPLDLVLIGSEGDYKHIALIVEEQGKLKIAQSAIGVFPAGVTVTELVINNNSPIFSYKPNLGVCWEELYSRGRLGFFRLKLLSGVN